jgi:hypothetical protein
VDDATMNDDETLSDRQPWCAMTLAALGRLLQQVWRERPPQPAAGQVRIRVAACGACRTDLHIVDGELPWPGHAAVPGHEIVGRIAALARASPAWLWASVGVSLGLRPLREQCLGGRENSARRPSSPAGSVTVLRIRCWPIRAMCCHPGRL